MSRSACDSIEMGLRVVAVFARQWEQCEYIVKGYRDGFVGKGAGKLEWSVFRLFTLGMAGWH
jgi:hypothetical protein